MIKPLVVIGMGGHSRVVCDVARDSGVWDLIGCVDGQIDAAFTHPVQRRHLGDDSCLLKIKEEVNPWVVVAVGSNELRMRLQQNCMGMNFRIATIVSTHAVVSKYAQIAEGVVVMPGAIINAGSLIGRGAIINTNSSIDHDCIIGEYTHIAPGCTLAGNVCVGDYSFLGAGTVAIPNMMIGKRVITGAGAVIISAIPDDSKVVGLPATRVL